MHPTASSAASMDKDGMEKEKGHVVPASSSPPSECPFSNAHTKQENISSESSSSQLKSPSSSSQTQQQAQPTDRKFLKILYLHHSITPLNFIAFLIAVFFSITFFVFLNAATGFVLTEILQKNKATGDAAGSLSFYDELLSIVMVTVWGIFSDKIGRRIVYVSGFLLIGLSMFLYPNSRNVYPELLLFRLIFAIGGSACSSMLTAVLGDCAGRLRGRISGLVGLMSGFGALLAVFVFLRLPASFEKPGSVSLGQGLQYTFYICGSLSILVAIFLWFSLQKRVFGKVERCPATGIVGHRGLEGTSGVRKKRDFWHLLGRGVAAMKDLKIAVAYFGGFAARGNTIIITIFLPLWVNKFYIDNGLCSTAGLDPRDEDGIKNSCRSAFTTASILSGTCQTFALIGAPIFGYLSDKLAPPEPSESYPALPDEPASPLNEGPSSEPSSAKQNKRKFSTLPIFLACVIAFVGYLLIFFIENPNNKVLYPIVALIGVGEIGTVVCSVAMVSGTGRIGGSLAKSRANRSGQVGARVDGSESDGEKDSKLKEREKEGKDDIGASEAALNEEDEEYLDEIRGTIAGVYSFFGGLGILFCTRLGGYLFDVWTYTAPFLLMSLVHALVAVGAFVVILIEWREKRMA